MEQSMVPRAKRGEIVEGIGTSFAHENLVVNLKPPALLASPPLLIDLRALAAIP
jgi:hypothetical protein